MSPSLVGSRRVPGKRIVQDLSLFCLFWPLYQEQLFGESATMNTRAAGKKARGYVSEGFHAIAALSWNTFLSGRASMRLALREPFRD
jgi:hypothetical protein